MGGKGAIFLVLGFSLLFLVFGSNFNNLTTSSMENYGKYFVESNALNIAVSGANMAANQVFMDKTWGVGYTDVPLYGGVLNVSVSNPLYSVSGKVKICHVPPGNPSARHTLELPPTAIAAHLAHGDYLGDCGTGIAFDPDMVTIVSEGEYSGFWDGDSQTVVKTVIVELRPSYFSKFGNYYTKMGAYPATGDTFNGPFHCQEKITTSGTPVFWGKVTSPKGYKATGSPASPKFYGDTDWNVDLPRDFDTTGMRSSAGKVFYDTTGAGRQTDVYLHFNSSGTVTWMQKIGTSGWTFPKTQSISSLAPGGVIYVEKGNIYVEGTVKGAVTIVATKKKLSGCGNIYQTDDLIYNEDPRIYPNSRDVLGMVAEENIRIQYNTNTKHQDIKTQASMYAMNGTIGPDDALIDNDGYLKRWLILGGLIAYNTRQTAYYSGSTPYKGYKFVQSYDRRLMTYVPPSFPKTKSFEVVSWYE